MLDKIVIKSKSEAWMIYTDRPPFILWSDVNVLDIIVIMLAPVTFNGTFKTYTESFEDTQEILIAA